MKSKKPVLHHSDEDKQLTYLFPKKSREGIYQLRSELCLEHLVVNHLFGT